MCFDRPPLVLPILTVRCTLELKRVKAQQQTGQPFTLLAYYELVALHEFLE
jgi:hypothetical protein